MTVRNLVPFVFMFHFSFFSSYSATETGEPLDEAMSKILGNPADPCP